MYKYMVVGLTVLVLGYAGYYFNSSKGGDMLVQAVAESQGVSSGVTFVEVYSGRYECGELDGCAVPTYFDLEEGARFSVFYTQDDGTVQPLHAGSWGVGNDGYIVFFVEESSTTTQKISNSIIAKINSLTISSFSKKKTIYSWMKEPIFTRISN
ncbi:MAG: hypothetical protein RLZZ308_342 [Candidatus Parcubacteria bacterium]|jgi:hypothetical protein